MKNGWGAVTAITSIAIPVLIFTFWFGGWVINVNSRLDGVESENRELKSEIGEMKSEMGEMKSDIRELRVIIEQRLPPPAPQ